MLADRQSTAYFYSIPHPRAKVQASVPETPPFHWALCCRWWPRLQGSVCVGSLNITMEKRKRATLNRVMVAVIKLAGYPKCIAFLHDSGGMSQVVIFSHRVPVQTGPFTHPLPSKCMMSALCGGIVSLLWIEDLGHPDCCQHGTDVAELLSQRSFGNFVVPNITMLENGG